MNKVFAVKHEEKVLSLFMNIDDALKECERLKDRKVAYFNHLYGDNMGEVNVNQFVSKNKIIYSVSITHKIKDSATGYCFEIEIMEVK